MTRRSPSARRLLSARKWATLAAVVCGTTLQLTNCRDEFGLFGVRTLYSSIFLPVNNLIIFMANVIATTIQSVVGI
ncbi:MAG: hypothetical protein U1A27_06225 [Phycisphaerae bacterium]